MSLSLNFHFLKIKPLEKGKLEKSSHVITMSGTHKLRISLLMCLFMLLSFRIVIFFLAIYYDITKLVH